MWNSDAYYEKILEGWEKSKTDKHVPYYVNHQSKRTQWDHPLFVKTMEELVDMNGIRYAAYRTAVKLRFLQKRLQLETVPVGMIGGAFERIGLHSAEGVITCQRLYGVLLDIFSITKGTGSSRPQHNAQQTAEVALNWLLNLYDPKRTGVMPVRSAKVALVILCTARLREKYRYFFDQLAPKGDVIARQVLRSFLHDIMQVPELINEERAFGGSNAAPGTASCFKGSFNRDGVSEDVFMNWMLREPQTIVWLPTMHRMQAAEKVRHESKCSVCKAFPLVGLRYKCLKCFNYDICQNCFFAGRTSKSHKLRHPTEEYCFTTTSKEDTKAFMKIIRNNISKKHCNKFKPRYLPIQGSDQPLNSQDIPDSTNKGVTDEFTATLPHKKSIPIKKQHSTRMPLQQHNGTAWQIGQSHATPPASNGVERKGLDTEERKQLESIITHLEEENHELLEELERLSMQGSGSGHLHDNTSNSHLSPPRGLAPDKAAKHARLAAHNKQLEMQLTRLKLLLREDEVDALPSIQLHHSAAQVVGEPMETAFPGDMSSRSYPPPPYRDSQDVLPSPEISRLTTLHSMPDSHNGIVRDVQASPGSMSLLDADLTYGSWDDAGMTILQPAGTSLRSLSPQHQTDSFIKGEEELADMIAQLEHAFPDNTTTKCYPGFDSNRQSVLDAAHGIGDAMSEFVGYIGTQQDQTKEKVNKSMDALAAELIASRVEGSDDDCSSEITNSDEEEDFINGPSHVYSMLDKEEQTPWPDETDTETDVENIPPQYYQTTHLSNTSSEHFTCQLQGAEHIMSDYSC